MNYKQQEWSSAHGTLGGKRTYMRKNASLLPVDKAQFPHVVIVNLIYREVREDGLPAADEELSRLDATEESVADQLQAAFGALFGLIVTSDGTRDLFFFLPEPESDDAIEAVIESCEPRVGYDFSMHEDPSWEPYVELMP